MVKLTFYGGVGEIGGNKILLEDGDCRIFLDFGVSFSRRSKYFEEFLPPRSANGIGDFLATNLLPDIRGIYREDLLIHLGREPEEPEISGVLLSHAHADHANYISFLHEDIPVYCGKTCKAILDAINEQSKRNIENEVIDFKRRPIIPGKKEEPIKRKFSLFRTGDTISIDSVDIEPIHVDHSVPGSYGFIIYTSKGAIVYTGDLRLHGTNPQLTLDFIERAKEEKPIAMITEGTRIDERKGEESEEKVYVKAKKELEESSGISIVDFNFKDVDRFKTFYRISEELDKFLVISFKHACFLERYHRDEKLDVPDSTDDRILLLKPKMRTGTYADYDYSSEPYIKSRLHYPNIITAEEISRRPDDYIVVLNYWYFTTLVDLKPEKGTYVHSLSEPFNEEMEISFDRMMEWLKLFNLRYVHAHCSGHAYGDDIISMIEEIKPTELYPIHTEKPDLFKSLPTRTIIVEEGITYEVGDG